MTRAAQDLGDSPSEAFRRVTLPLAWPGVVAGSLLVFIPMLGEYLNPVILGGDKTADVAVFRIDVKGLTPLPVAASFAEVGSWVGIISRWSRSTLMAGAGRTREGRRSRRRIT